MTLGGIFDKNFNPYSYYSGFSQNRTDAVSAGSAVMDFEGNPATEGDSAIGKDGQVIKKGSVSADPEHQVKPGYKSSPANCQACKERRYQDGSDEDDVSFKTPGHISPGASAATVAAHEHEHVVNAYEKAAESGGKVLSCTVTLETAICPECGTSYVAGGKTSTTISTPKESKGDSPSTMVSQPEKANPYQKDQEAKEATRLVGARIDYVANQYKNNITE